MENFIELGKSIYNLSNPREARRFVVFLARCYLHPQRISELKEFFSRSETLTKLAKNFPFFYEQITRAFFFYKSDFTTRKKIVEDSLNFFTQTLDDNFLIQLYGGTEFELWKTPLDENLGDLRLSLAVFTGQRKEGIATIILQLSDNTPIYQINFWIAQDNLISLENSTGDLAMWIGAMQGPNVKDSRELIKIITKKCHAYRTKNLILYAAQAVARSLGLKKIFAVTNYGYYANNHVRRDRKLKTSFSDFWAECGGILTSDKRFFELPLIEPRKSYEEIPVRKRAVYKRRFELLDNLDATVEEKILSFKKK